MFTKIQTVRQVHPMIYAYSTPEIRRHDGWVKIGYTESQTVEDRIKQQAHTLDTITDEQWRREAVFPNGKSFTDHDLHAYLQKLGIDRIPNTEWFHLNGEESEEKADAFIAAKGRIKTDQPMTYELRNEQVEAVDMALKYSATHPNSRFLINGKPRLGKCLLSMDFIRKSGAKKVLIVTNRPAIANSWYDDYETFIGQQNGYWFVSTTASVKDRRSVISPFQFEEVLKENPHAGMIRFMSLQDLKQSRWFGGKMNKHKDILDTCWDLLIVDESHEGIDTLKADVAFDNVRSNFSLYLSGTPFKALAQGDFPPDAIFNWTYADEQKAKRDWSDPELPNPYEYLPTLNMFTYEMADIIRDRVEQGLKIGGDSKIDFAFDLNEFFRTDPKSKKFIHEDSVDRFLDALTYQDNFPFSTPELRSNLAHTFWYLNRVDSAVALKKKLEEHPVFKNYKVVLAAGHKKNEEDDQEANATSLKKVQKAISENPLTITLSVGQLTTGVTVKPWSAVLMLCNLSSPSQYMQAAFRAQNPYLYSGKDEEGNDSFYRKENAYVFDFDSSRTLQMYEQFANDLIPTTSNGGGTDRQRNKNVQELLNFFPVIGEEGGRMVELDAEKVLSIPHKVKAREVMNHGFMSNLLFANIGNIFHAPKAVADIIRKLEPAEEPKNKKEDPLPEQERTSVEVDSDGNVDIPEEKIIGTAQGVFGEKVYRATSQEEQDIGGLLADTCNFPKVDRFDVDRLADYFKSGQQVVEQTGDEHFGTKVGGIAKKAIKNNADQEARRVATNLNIERQAKVADLKNEKEEQLTQAKTEEEKQKIVKKFNQKRKKLDEETAWKVEAERRRLQQEEAEAYAKAALKAEEEVKTRKIEDEMRNRLRGFSRTIPSFLMAYGDKNLTLNNIEEYVEDDEVFKAVTNITKEEFILLRDGGEVLNKETGEMEHYPGNLFNSVVFNDSVQAFMEKRDQLKNYFNELQPEDIFDYIPPQRNNRIFTPKWMVKKMVDLLEEQEPGVFNDPNKTFIDLYMKSGMFLAEIIRRLYISKEIKKLIPDKKERITHIIKHQIYGLAPTPVIYNMAVNYILGFDESLKPEDTNLILLDSLKAIEEGTLEQQLDQYFPEMIG